MGKAELEDKAGVDFLLSPPLNQPIILPCPAPWPAVLAYFIASFAPSLDMANALLPTYVVTLLFFAGLLFKLDMIPKCAMQTCFAYTLAQPAPACPCLHVAHLCCCCGRGGI